MRRAVSFLLPLSSLRTKSLVYSAAALLELSPQSSPPTFLPSLSPFRFPICPLSRRLHTLPAAPPAPSRSAATAATAGNILAAFESLDSSIDDDWPDLADRLELLGPQELEKALALTLRALHILEKRDGGWSLPVAKVLALMGSVTCKMRRFDDSLESLDTAAQILGELRRDNVTDVDVVKACIAVQLQLASTKNAMGRRRDAMINLRSSLELKGSIRDITSHEMGAAYRDLAEGYAALLNFYEAFPSALRALDIYSGKFGDSSVEVVQIRRLLGVIYAGLDENEEALEQNELSMRVLESLGLDEELIQVQIDMANILIALGRLEKAINMLKRVLQQTDKESETRALAFIAMAEALCNQEKFDDSRRCLQLACSILDKKEVVCPAKVAKSYADISMVYETMNDFEIALSLMKRILAILEDIPQEQRLAGSISARIGWLLLFTKRVPQSIPYLETAAKTLKECFGSKHFGLGFVYKHLGQAYLDMDQPESAAKMLVLAKDIIEKCFGPKHDDAIDTYQCLANAYGIMGRYSLAMEFQQQVIDACESHGPSAMDELREASRLMVQLKKKAEGSPAAVFPANTLPLLPKS